MAVDTDLNTPASTEDGALDWMGVAHLLGVEGAMPALARLGPRVPMLRPEQVLFFANGYSQPFERKLMEDLALAEVPLPQVAADPAGAAETVATGWARQFERFIAPMGGRMTHPQPQGFSPSRPLAGTTPETR